MGNHTRKSNCTRLCLVQLLDYYSYNYSLISLKCMQLHILIACFTFQNGQSLSNSSKCVETVVLWKEWCFYILHPKLLILVESDSIHACTYVHMHNWLTWFITLFWKWVLCEWKCFTGNVSRLVTDQIARTAKHFHHAQTSCFIW